MTASSENPAQDALDALAEVVAELREAVGADTQAVLDDGALHRCERATAIGIAMLVATREEAAAALEASVAGAMPRDEPALARDLLLVVDMLHRALEQALS